MKYLCERRKNTMDIPGKKLSVTMIIITILILNACGVEVDHVDRERYSNSYEQGYVDGIEEIPQTLYTNTEIDENGNHTLINVVPGSTIIRSTTIDGEEFTSIVLYPKGVKTGCYEQGTYLSELDNQSYLSMYLEFDSFDIYDPRDFEILVENVIVTFTVSRLEEHDGMVMSVPVKTYKKRHSMKHQFQAVNDYLYDFQVSFNPMFLEQNTYQPGRYAITDLWITYQLEDGIYHKVHGGCSSYQFDVVDNELVEYETETIITTTSIL